MKLNNKNRIKDIVQISKKLFKIIKNYRENKIIKPFYFKILEINNLFFVIVVIALIFVINVIHVIRVII